MDPTCSTVSSQVRSLQISNRIEFGVKVPQNSGLGNHAVLILSHSDPLIPQASFSSSPTASISVFLLSSPLLSPMFQFYWYILFNKCCVPSRLAMWGDLGPSTLSTIRLLGILRHHVKLKLICICDLSFIRKLLPGFDFLSVKNNSGTTAC